MNEFARFSKRAVDYLWDRPARNDDPSPICCLGCTYESTYNHPRPSSSSTPGTSPESAISHADSAVVTESNNSSSSPQDAADDELVKSFDQVQMSKSMEEEDLGWPAEFLDDFESKFWLTYRNSFPPIHKSSDPAAQQSNMSFATKLRSIANQGAFTSDTGWGCMIRSGQSLLANTVVMLRLGREWRRGKREKEHYEILSLFADTPEAPFSIHKFVEHGAKACGTYPGEWFGPSATARSIRALTESYHDAGLRVYARPNDSDVYIDALLQTATSLSADSETFQPTLIVLGIRLGIDKVTSAYHSALKAALELPQSVGIAGGRPSSSHYFVGHQGDNFFYLDPHTTQHALSPQPDRGDVESCHTRRVRRINIAEMDPSMLLGFLVRDKEDFERWRKAVREMPGKAIIHVHETEVNYEMGRERAGAVDEVETMDEDEDGEW